LALTSDVRDVLPLLHSIHNIVTDKLNPQPVAGHQCHERDSDVIVRLTSYVKTVNSLLAECIHSRFQICKKY